MSPILLLEPRKRLSAKSNSFCFFFPVTLWLLATLNSSFLALTIVQSVIIQIMKWFPGRGDPVAGP